MNNLQFLFCRDCNAVHRITPFDTAPVFEIDGGDVLEFPRDDRRMFFERHEGHVIGKLLGIDEQRFENDGFIDPMKVHYFEVTDGRENFIVRSFRYSIAEPLAYEVLPRQMMLWNIAEAPRMKHGKTVNPAMRRGYRNRTGKSKCDIPLFPDLGFSP